MRVSRRRKRKLDRPRVVQKAHQIYPLRGRARADLPKPAEILIALVPNVGSFGKQRSAVAAKPFGARNAAVSVRRESLAVVARKFSLCSTNSHPAVQAVGLTVLLRTCFGVPAQSRNVSWRKAGGPLPAPRTVQRDPSSASGTSPQWPHPDREPIGAR